MNTITDPERLPAGVYDVRWYRNRRLTTAWDRNVSADYVRRVASQLRPTEGIVAVCRAPQAARFQAGLAPDPREDGAA